MEPQRNLQGSRVGWLGWGGVSLQPLLTKGLSVRLSNIISKDKKWVGGWGLLRQSNPARNEHRTQLAHAWGGGRSGPNASYNTYEAFSSHGDLH